MLAAQLGPQKEQQKLTSNGCLLCSLVDAEELEPFSTFLGGGEERKKEMLWMKRTARDQEKATSLIISDKNFS